MKSGAQIMHEKIGDGPVAPENYVLLCKRVLCYREFLRDLVLVKSDTHIDLSWDPALPHDAAHFRVNHFEPDDWPTLSDHLVLFLDVLPAQAYC